MKVSIFGVKIKGHEREFWKHILLSLFNTSVYKLKQGRVLM